jgi:hypothetical protein
LYDSLGISVVINGDLPEDRAYEKSPAGSLVTQVAMPEFQTLASLREKVLGEKEAFEKRQRREFEGGL